MAEHYGEEAEQAERTGDDAAAFTAWDLAISAMARWIEDRSNRNGLNFEFFGHFDVGGKSYSYQTLQTRKQMKDLGGSDSAASIIAKQVLRDLRSYFQVVRNKDLITFKPDPS